MRQSLSRQGDVVNCTNRKGGVFPIPTLEILPALSVRMTRNPVISQGMSIGMQRLESEIRVSYLERLVNFRRMLKYEPALKCEVRAFTLG